MPGDVFYAAVEEAARDLYITSQKDIPPDVRAALAEAADRETAPQARQALEVMLRAIAMADERKMLVCQDTGIPIFWVSIGAGLCPDGLRLEQALIRGTARATTEHPFRSSVVSPLGRVNRQDSTGKRVPVIHYSFTNQHSELELLFVPKGSGSENMSFLKMLVPADGLTGIKKFVLDCVIEAGGKPCPPTIVGVGLGGTADLCAALAKEAAVRPVGSHNPDPQLAELEDELLRAINRTGIGPMGLGGDTTALAVHIEDAWTHITMNPVAVSLQCWRGERRRALIDSDGATRYAY